jgi:hypothetical protein
MLVVATSALVLGACGDDTDDRLGTASSTTASTTTVTVAHAMATTTVPSVTVATTSTNVPATTVSVATTAPRPAISAITTGAAAPLFGVAIGAPADGAVSALTTALGKPSNDSGWGVGCPLDSATLKNERVVTWGRLRVQFRRETDAAPGTLQGYGFVVPEGSTLAAGDAASRLALPNGITVGMPIAEVANKLATTAELNDTFGWMSVTTPGAVFTADGAGGAAKLNAVSVPHVFSCD